MSPRQPFTDRQREVVRLIAAGRTNPEIAEALDIHVNTVVGHIQRISRKLGVDRRRDIPGAYSKQTGESPYPQPRPRQKARA